MTNRELLGGMIVCGIIGGLIGFGINGNLQEASFGAGVGAIAFIALLILGS